VEKNFLTEKNDLLLSVFIRFVLAKKQTCLLIYTSETQGISL